MPTEPELSELKTLLDILHRVSSKLRDAIIQYMDDHRSDGCSDPNCRVCAASREANAVLEKALDDFHAWEHSYERALSQKESKL